MLPTVGFTPNKPIASGDAGIEIDPTLMTWNADSSRPIEFRVIGGMLIGPTNAPELLTPKPMAGTVIGGTLIGPTNAPEWVQLPVTPTLAAPVHDEAALAEVAARVREAVG